LSRREAPAEFGEVVGPVFEPPDHRGLVGRPDVVARLQVWDRVRHFTGIRVWENDAR